MNDAELRALVREAVGRHLGGAADAAPAAGAPASEGTAAPSPVSHGVYVALVNGTDRCVIEPSVPCEHCGYCKAHGY